MERTPANKPLRCTEACPYLTSLHGQLEYEGENMVDSPMTRGIAGIGAVYLWRLFKARRCEGPLPLSPEGEVTYCTYRDEALFCDGQSMARIVQRNMPDESLDTAKFFEDEQ